MSKSRGSRAASPGAKRECFMRMLIIGRARQALSVAAAAVLLAGCATAAQRQYQAMASNNRSAMQDLQACTIAVYDSPEYAPFEDTSPTKSPMQLWNNFLIIAWLQTTRSN